MLGYGSLVLCAQTVRSTTFEEKVEIAAAAGYAGVSVGPQEVAEAIERIGSATVARRMVEDAGLEIADLDAFSDWLDEWDTVEATAKRIVQIAADIGARAINVIDHAPKVRREDEYVVERFARICDLAAEADVLVYIECARGTAAKDLATGGRIVQEAGRSNGGLLLDTWHYQRGRAGEENQIVDWAGAVRMVQMSDAAPEPTGTYFEETMTGRRLPGMGVVDLHHILRELVKAGADAPIGVEVISDDLLRLPPLTAARLAAVATQGILDTM